MNFNRLFAEVLGFLNGARLGIDDARELVCRIGILDAEESRHLARFLIEILTIVVVIIAIAFAVSDEVSVIPRGHLSLDRLLYDARHRLDGLRR